MKKGGRNMNKTINFESLEAVYTHTSIFTRQWSKGGSISDDTKH